MFDNETTYPPRQNDDDPYKELWSRGAFFVYCEYVVLKMIGKNWCFMNITYGMYMIFPVLTFKLLYLGLSISDKFRHYMIKQTLII